jgi:serine/threonine protein kinase
MADISRSRRTPRIEAFELAPGRILAGKYRVENLLGSGWEGEVYRVTELRTDVHRAAKLFYPHRNVRERAVRFYARKLDRLRHSSIVIQYHHLESLRFRGEQVSCLISDLVEGQILERFVASQPRRRLQPFEALHLLHALVVGLEEIHRRREYHGDVHDRNVVVKRRGIRFDVKAVDFHHWGRPDRSQIQEDVIQAVQLLYDAVGGRRHYASQPDEIKRICLGLRRDLITRKFPTAGHLRHHLETFDWD